MLKSYRLQGSRLTPSSSADSTVLVYVHPDESEKTLLRELGIDDHTLRSALDPDEPSRLESSVDHLTLIYKIPKNYSAQDRFQFKVASMGLFLYADKLIIALSDELHFFEDERFKDVKDLEDVFLKVILVNIHHYHEHLKIMMQITEEIEQKIMVSSENRQLISLFSIEKSLVYYVYALESNGFALDKLKTAASTRSFLKSKEGELDDICIENAQSSRQADIYSSILANLMDARVSLIGNNLNVLMKTLNVVTICIMVPTLIVSVFSMNIVLPIEDHPNAFWIVLILSVLSVLGVLVWWRLVSKRLSKQVL